MKKRVVLYHKDCLDGFAACFAAWKRFGSTAEYRGVRHEEPPPLGLEGRDIFLLDFCYPAKTLQRLSRLSRCLTVIDHHITQEAALRYAHEYRYDIEHSGCVLAWRYFFPHRKVPILLSVIEDQDLFLFTLPFTKEYTVALRMVPHLFRDFEKTARSFESARGRKEFQKKGEVVMDFYRVCIADITQTAEPVLFEGVKTYAVNTSLLYSETAHRLTSLYKVPFAVTWFYRKGRVHVSLRSAGKYDVGKLAVKYGGGGHKGAAGFSFIFKGVFPWKKRK